MIRDIGVHGSDHAKVVCAGTDVFENLAYFQTTFAIAIEFIRGSECRPCLAFGGQAAGNFLAVPFVERWLGVKCIDMRRAAVGENVNDVFGLAGLLGWFHGQGIGGSGGFLKHGAQREGSQAHAAAIEEVASGEE